MRHWLLKTEPHCWSWSDQQSAGQTSWDGVRNFQAQKYIKEMRLNDEAFFYHTGNERRIVGIVTVVKEAYPEPNEPGFFMVDVATKSSVKKPITLKKIKEHPNLQHLALIKQGRLSVVPLDAVSWQTIYSFGC